MALPIDLEAGLQDETNNLVPGAGRLPNNGNEARIEEREIRAEVPLDINSQIVVEAHQRSEPERSI